MFKVNNKETSEHNEWTIKKRHISEHILHFFFEHIHTFF